MVACGGEQKKDDKAADQNKQEQNDKAAADLTISQIFDQMFDAIQNDDMARFIELAKVVDSWGDELTPAQEEELEAYAMQNFEKMMVVMEAAEKIDLDEYEGDCDCCVDECEDECCMDCEEPMLYEGDCDCCVDCEETMLYEVECEGECCDEDYDYADEDYEDEWSDEEEW